MTGKLNNARVRAREAAASLAPPRAGQLVMFPTAKKRRGRPSKPPATPSQDDFDIVCAAIRGIPTGRPWARAKAEACRLVSIDPRTRCNSAAVAVFARVMEAFNHKQGRDWHSVSWYAKPDQCNRPTRAIERGFKALVSAGHLLRRRKSKGKGWDITETTSPTLARAGNGLPSEVETPTEIRSPTGTVRKFYRYRQIIRRVPSLKYGGSRQTNTSGTVTGVGLTSKINLQENIQGNIGNLSARGVDAAPDDFSDLKIQEAAKPAADASQSESTQGQSRRTDDRAAAGAGVRVGERAAERDPTPGRANPGTSSSRFDQSLPLRQRVKIWDFSGQARTAADAQLLADLKRAAKGWSLDRCLDQYAGYAAERDAFQQPRDAHKAFLAYLRKTIGKPATGWHDFGAAQASGSKKNSRRPTVLWAGTAEFETELRLLYREDPREASRIEDRGWVRATWRRPTRTTAEFAASVLRKARDKMRNPDGGSRG